MAIEFVPRFAVDDRQLSMLHARAFAADLGEVRPWSQRLEKHALTWIGAFDAEQLVGFIQVCWDGGAHAFLLDAVVDPDRQHHGIGASLVSAAADGARVAGCEWLHVDFEPHLEHFYLGKCGFEKTQAGIIRLR